MSIHISAKNGEIARIVLIAGDPLRAKHIAEIFLEDCKLVSNTRNVFYFTPHHLTSSPHGEEAVLQIYSNNYIFHFIIII